MKDVYELLNQPSKIEHKILRCKYEIEGLRGKLLPGSMNYRTEKIQKTASADRKPEIINQIDELEHVICVLKREKEKAIDDIKITAEKLPENQKTVILGVYVAEKAIKDIADDMGYSIQRIYQYRSEAIKFLKKNQKKH